jgi:hypothetical protein
MIRIVASARRDLDEGTFNGDPERLVTSFKMSKSGRDRQPVFGPAKQLRFKKSAIWCDLVRTNV